MAINRRRYHLTWLEDDDRERRSGNRRTALWKARSGRLASASYAIAAAPAEVFSETGLRGPFYRFARRGDDLRGLLERRSPATPPPATSIRTAATSLPSPIAATASRPRSIRASPSWWSTMQQQP